MRTALPLPLILLMLASLAACGRSDDPSSNTMHPTSMPDNATIVAKLPANDVTTTDPGANESAAADQADAMPIALQGRWTGAQDRCNDPGAEQQLEVTPTELIFHESVGTIKQVTRKEGDGVHVTAAFTGEGESWSRTLTMRQSEDGQRLTVANDGQAIVRKRCGGD